MESRLNGADDAAREAIRREKRGQAAFISAVINLPAPSLSQTTTPRITFYFPHFVVASNRAPAS